MVYRIELSKAAENDIEEVVEYYLTEGTPATATKFIEVYETVEEAISTRPLSFPVIHPKGLRRARFLVGFKCSVLFVIRDEVIFIIAVFMDKRNPNIWKDRI